MKKSIIFVLLIFSSVFLFSQTKITYNGSGNYMFRERTDLRQYTNGKYVGLVSRVVSSFIIPVSYEDGYLYEGNFFLQQETNRNASSVTPTINDNITSSFKINSDGKLTMIEDNGYPSFRSFPTFPENEINIGDTWTGEAIRAVDPLNKGVVTRMKIYVQYTYKADEYLNGEPVYVISALWATRYGIGSGSSYIDWGGDKDLKKASGKHEATIYVSKLSGNMLIARDNVDEMFEYTDGNRVQFRGNISLFTEYPPTYDKTKLMPVLKRIIGLNDKETEIISNKPEVPVIVAKADNIPSKNENKVENTEVFNTDTNNNIDNTITDSFITESLNYKQTDYNTNYNTDNFDNNTDNKIAKSEYISSELPMYETVGKKSKIDVEVSSTPAGIKLSINNLQFKADSSELLPDEIERLTKIAEILRSVPGAQLLVEGHTADTGNPVGEQNLSEERARAIAEALVQRGVKPERFICKGHGGKRPIASNNTPEGKAKNRRVEITILD